MKIVLQKLIASTGYSSRRKAEELIRNKKVKVNGALAELGMKADKEDEILINNKKIKSQKKDHVYIVLNKPRGYTCTKRKFKNERNIFELLPKNLQNIGLNAAGRLDKDSHGLLLLTNDGDLIQKLTHPKFSHEKKYIVKISGEEIKKKEIEEIIEKFKRGVYSKNLGCKLKAKSVRYLKNNEFEIILTQGKKRQIREMFKEVKREIMDLKRVSFGDFKLGDLEEGEWKKIKTEERC